MTQKYYLSTFMKAIMISGVLMQILKAKLEAEDFTNITKDDLLGDILYTTALAYFAELDTMNYVQAKTMGVNITRLPSMSIFSFELSIATSFYDTPISASPEGLAMDVDQNVHVVKALDGDLEKPQQFMLASGQNGSALEHSVPEQLFSTPTDPAEGISAVKALKIANEQGIPIYTIDQSNIDSILPQLEVDANVKTDIQNAVNAGKVVTVPKTNINFNGWIGCGYIIIDPNTGAGAYMISGGLSGGFIGGFLNFLLDSGLIVLLTLRGAGIIAIGWLLAIVLGPIIFALETVITSAYYFLSTSYYYLIPFLLPAVPYCLDLPPNVPWVVMGICTIILALVFMRETRR